MSKDLSRRNFTSLTPRPLIIGVDPGLNGAVAVVHLDTGDIVDMIDMPTYKKASKARKSGFLEFIDIHKVAMLLDMYAPSVALAVLEEPGAMPEQGLSSTFRFGHICGQIHGVLAGLYIPVMPVKPAIWKNALALSSNKDDSCQLANTEFPEFKELWALKKHNDRAEAALLTVYAKKYLAGIIKLSRK